MKCLWPNWIAWRSQTPWLRHHLIPSLSQKIKEILHCWQWLSMTETRGCESFPGPFARCDWHHTTRIHPSPVLGISQEVERQQLLCSKDRAIAVLEGQQLLCQPHILRTSFHPHSNHTIVVQSSAPQGNNDDRRCHYQMIICNNDWLHTPRLLMYKSLSTHHKMFVFQTA